MALSRHGLLHRTCPLRGESGHAFLHRASLLLTQSGHSSCVHECSHKRQCMRSHQHNALDCSLELFLGKAMRRREFTNALLGTIAAWPLAVADVLFEALNVYFRQ